MLLGVLLLMCAGGEKWSALDFHADSGDQYSNVGDMNGTYSAVSSASARESDFCFHSAA